MFHMPSVLWDFQMRFSAAVKELVSVVFGCLACYALKQRGCQQQAHSSFHKSDGHADLFRAVFGVHQYTRKITEVVLSPADSEVVLSPALKPTNVFLMLGQVFP